MPPRSTTSDRPSRVAQQRAMLDLLREVGGDRVRAATRLEVDAAGLQERIRELGILRQAAALTRDDLPPSRGVVVRRAGDKPHRVRPSAPVPPPLPERGAGRPPKGRVTLGASAQRDRSELHGEPGRNLLRELVRSHRGHPPTILRRLNDLFVAPKARALTPADLDSLLAKHGLAKEAETAATERLLALLGQHRGDLSRIAEALKMTREELLKDLKARGQAQNFERARDRYRRDVFGKSLNEQAFMLVERRSTLSDLGALSDLERQLGETVRGAWAKTADNAPALRVRRLGALLALSDDSARALAKHFQLR